MFYCYTFYDTTDGSFVVLNKHMLCSYRNLVYIQCILYVNLCYVTRLAQNK